MKTLLPLLFTIFVLFVSCKKDDKDKQQTTADKILGRWTYINAEEVKVVNGSSTTKNYPGGPGDYFEFMPDGRLILSISMVTGTQQYSIPGENQISITTAQSTDIHTITTLTATDLVYTLRKQTSASDYTVVTNILRR